MRNKDQKLNRCGDNNDPPEVITLGCRLNACESEVICTLARAAGLNSQTMIINTCAVTAEAVRQASQKIRSHRRDVPKAKIVVTGCAAQIEPQRFIEMPEVDHVIGNSEKLQADVFLSLKQAKNKYVQVGSIMSVRQEKAHIIDSSTSRTRAFVRIQNGCDHNCTFCVVPQSRGPSRSIPASDIIVQIRRLLKVGHKEIVLTGVDITSYGNDLAEDINLGCLVRKVLRDVPELKRLRLSSIDYIEVDTVLLDCIANEPRLMPHLHLSIQAGHDLILKRMKRRHRRNDVIRFCRQIRTLRPDVIFGADFIAGFPTETEEMFQATLDIVDECDLTYLHVFPFSSRSGTPAAKMPQLERKIIKQRSRSLRSKAAIKLAEFFDSQEGLVHDVLLEKNARGLTPQFAPVKIMNCDQSAITPGTIVRMKITKHDKKCLFAEQI
ncbi:MAG TPA: Threonylcarbamoyladenosine tRNA methylthiotransferase MtaB [Hyphomicrobiaceae bacterium MAG_BT-2024]